ncbi:YgaB family protein [Bacillus marasmi]|uniref:YgaB family protein n=1 Tax=Bacillus marasmi TaxID=1926279 RepID=UPI0011CC44C5|nr:YgaB family protein [Bacillus marasmi]
MNDFNRLISAQMKTMDKLLEIQTELESSQKIEQELLKLEDATKLALVQSEIIRKKQELREIHEIFEQQTEDVIRTYQELNPIC